MDSKKYVVLNGSLKKSGKGNLYTVAYASSFEKAKEIAKKFIKCDKDLKEKSTIRNNQRYFVTAIKLNSDDITEYKFYKEVK